MKEISITKQYKSGGISWLWNSVNRDTLSNVVRENTPKGMKYVKDSISVYHDMENREAKYIFKVDKINDDPLV